MKSPHLRKTSTTIAQNKFEILARKIPYAWESKKYCALLGRNPEQSSQSLSCDILTHTPAQRSSTKLPAVVICSTILFYKLSWAWAWAWVWMSQPRTWILEGLLFVCLWGDVQDSFFNFEERSVRSAILGMGMGTEVAAESWPAASRAGRPELVTSAFSCGCC